MEVFLHVHFGGRIGGKVLFPPTFPFSSNFVAGAKKKKKKRALLEGVLWPHHWHDHAIPASESPQPTPFITLNPLSGVGISSRAVKSRDKPNAQRLHAGRLDSQTRPLVTRGPHITPPRGTSGLLPSDAAPLQAAQTLRWYQTPQNVATSCACKRPFLIGLEPGNPQTRPSLSGAMRK